MEKYIQFFLLVLGLSGMGLFLLRLLPGKSIAEEIWPRLSGWLVVTVVLLTGLYFIAPEQAKVVYYKFALVIGAAFLGYWIDRVLFPYARPDGYLKKFWHLGSDETVNEADHQVVENYHLVFGIAMIRRALIIVAVVLGATLGM